MNWITEILPILGIGLIFAITYELVLWLSQKLIENDSKEKIKRKKRLLTSNFFIFQKNKRTLHELKEKRISLVLQFQKNFDILIYGSKRTDRRQ